LVEALAEDIAGVILEERFFRVVNVCVVPAVVEAREGNKGRECGWPIDSGWRRGGDCHLRGKVITKTEKSA
jgi:hypothetical protein